MRARGWPSQWSALDVTLAGLYMHYLPFVSRILRKSCVLVNLLMSRMRLSQQSYEYVLTASILSQFQSWILLSRLFATHSRSRERRVFKKLLHLQVVPGLEEHLMERSKEETWTIAYLVCRVSISCCYWLSFLMISTQKGLPVPDQMTSTPATIDRITPRGHWIVGPSPRTQWKQSADSSWAHWGSTLPSKHGLVPYWVRRALFKHFRHAIPDSMQNEGHTSSWWTCHQWWSMGKFSFQYRYHYHDPEDHGGVLFGHSSLITMPNSDVVAHHWGVVRAVLQANCNINAQHTLRSLQTLLSIHYIKNRPE